MDPTYLFLFVALAGFIVFQVFQGRKRKRETEAKLSKFLPGVEIMTNYGLYGTIVAIDDEKNLVTLEISPGVDVKIHKQTMLKVADYDDVPADSSGATDSTDADAEAEFTEDAPGSSTASATPSFSAADPATEPAPAYGERIIESSDADGSPIDGAHDAPASDKRDATSADAPSDGTAR